MSLMGLSEKGGVTVARFQHAWTQTGHALASLRRLALFDVTQHN